jgi:hypothetical protein
MFQIFSEVLQIITGHLPKGPANRHADCKADGPGTKIWRRSANTPRLG